MGVDSYDGQIRLIVYSLELCFLEFLSQILVVSLSWKKWS